MGSLSLFNNSTKNYKVSGPQNLSMEGDCQRLWQDMEVQYQQNSRHSGKASLFYFEKIANLIRHTKSKIML
jgi:hypothetical protein